MVDLGKVQTPAIDPGSVVFAEQFGTFLRERGSVPEEGLHRAKNAMRDTRERFDWVLTRLGLIADADMAQLTAQYLGLDYYNVLELPLTPLPLHGVDPDYFRRTGCLPLRNDGNVLIVASADPFRSDAPAALAFQIGRPVRLVVATASEVKRSIEKLYGAANEPARGAALDAESPVDMMSTEDDIRRLKDLASEAPVIRMVHDIIVQAVECGASDIHLEDGEGGIGVRQRIDGLLEAPNILPAAVSAAVISRVKIMARMNIAERRLPQDGRIRVNVHGRDVELRVSTMPTLRGESVVLRILDRSAVSLNFEKLGFRGPLLRDFLSLIDRPNGLLLVTGPTGSGKSTTLYAALDRLNQPHRKTFTIEDPVETQIKGVSQIQVQPRIGLTFPSILRAILRQDPDVILVGEIRDLETAQLAIQASLTGHLVLATLHTNSAAATVARLVDMGVESYLIASTLKGTLAQRLVRRLCIDCARPSQPTPALKACLSTSGYVHNEQDVDWRLLREPVGCSRCRHTGYRGRIAIFELLVVTDAVARSIVQLDSEKAVATAARIEGMTAMLCDGLEKVLLGETTLEEVLRVTQVV